MKRFTSFLLVISLILSMVPVSITKAAETISIRILGMKSDSLMIGINGDIDENSVLQWHDSSSNTWISSDKALGSTYEITSLKSDTNYTIRVVDSSQNDSVISNVLNVPTQGTAPNVNIDYFDDSICVHLSKTSNLGVKGNLSLSNPNGEVIKENIFDWTMGDNELDFWFDGLQPNINYTLYVIEYPYETWDQTYNNWGDISITKTVRTGESNYKPPKPVDVKVNRVTSETTDLVTFSLTYSDSSVLNPNMSLDVELSVDGVNWLASTQSDNYELFTTEIDIGSSLYYRFRTVYNEEYSDWTKAIYVPANSKSELSAPTNFIIKSVAETSAVLEWQSIEKDCTFSIDLLDSRSGEDPVVYNNIRSNTFTLNNLKPGTDYICWVKAVSNQIESDTAYVNFTTKGGNAEFPYSVTVDNISTNSARLVLSNFPTSLKYTLVIDSVPVDISNTYPVYGDVMTLGNLSPDTLYKITLKTVFEDKEHSKDYGTFRTLKVGGEETKNVFRDIKTSNSTNNSILISWRTFDELKGVTYNVNVKDSSGSVAFQTSTRSQSVTATGLKMNTSYTATIDCMIDGKSYSISTTSFVLDPSQSENNDTYNYKEVSGFDEIDCGVDTVILQWDETDEDVQQYEIGFRKKGESQYTYAFTTSNFQMFEGLDPGSTYEVKIRARSGYLVGPWKYIEVVTRPDGAVKGTKVSSVSKSSVKLEWNKLDGANAYVVQYYKYNDPNNSKTVTVYDKNSLTVKSLKSGTQYEFNVFPMRVSTDKKIDSGYDYGAGGYVKALTKPAKASTVSSLKYKSDSNITFSVKSVTSAKKYYYEIWNNSKKVMSGNSKSKSITVSNKLLKKNAMYKIKVRAKNDSGYGDWSDWKYFSHQSTIKKVKKSGKSNIKVTWNKTSNAGRYILYGSTKKTGKFTKITTTSKTSYTVKKIGKIKLKKGKTYYFYIVSQKKVSGKWVTLDAKPYSKRWKLKLK